MNTPTKKALCLLALTVALLLGAAPTVAFGLLLRVGPGTVVSGKDDIAGVRMAGRVIAWTEKVGTAWRAWVRRPTGELVDITGASTFVERRAPAIASDRWVIFNGGYTNKFVVYDTQTGSPSILLLPAAWNYGDSQPVADGNRLVWVRREPTVGEQYSLWTGLITGTPPVLSDAEVVETFATGVTMSGLTLSGSQLGYMRTTGATSDFVTRNVPDGVSAVVKANTKDYISNPGVTGRYFGWNIYEGGVWQVYAKSRTSGAVSKGLVDPVSGSPAFRYPSFSGDNVAYSYADVLPGTQNLHLWNVPSGRQLQVSSGYDAEQPSLDGRFAAFVADNGAPSGRFSVMRTWWYLGTDRVSGATRYDTAAAAARSSYPAPNGWNGVTHVVVASGEDKSVVDALAAAGLCWKYDAPLLLTGSGTLPGSTATALNEIKAADPGVQVLIVGGTGSVPDARLEDMRTIVGAGQVTRIAGATRYDTAAKIAERMRIGPGGRPFPAKPYALVANGADANKFVDALALSAVSRATGFPIVLVGLSTVPTASKNALAAMWPQGVIIAGGTGSVSAKVYTEVGGSARWAGADRYDTAKWIAANAAYLGYSIPTSVAFTSKVVDGLAGGAMVGRDRGVLLLTKTTTPVPSATSSFLRSNATDILSSRVMGGTGVVGAPVVTEINTTLNP